MKSVVQVFTISMSIIFSEGLSPALEEAGYRLHIISADGPEAREGQAKGEFTFHPVEMARGLSPVQNLKCLFRVRRILKEIQPDIVHGNTPIGGLIAMSAAWSLGIRNRVYTMHGLKYPSETGLKRSLIKALEKMTVRLSTKSFAVSNGLKDFAIAEGVAPEGKLEVLKSGSVKGIDVEKSRAIRDKGRSYYEGKYGLCHDTCRIGYFGRINEEKGVPEFIDALAEIWKKHPDVEALICGPDEMVREQNKQSFQALRSDARVQCPGFVSEPLERMVCCDFIVLPTHREGFGLVNIEANSVGVPVLTTDVMGCKDSIEDGVTGLFFPAGDRDEMVRKMEYLITHPAEAARMGQAGVRRAEALFDRREIWAALIGHYDRMTDKEKRA